ncbi:MAG: alpha/beta fold hydrolase [Kouleothrix sp.]
MRTITLDHEGAALVADYYPALAPTGAPPVLLVHGWGGSGRYWRGTAERLREHFDVIVPDMPGVGRSLPVRRPYDMPMHAAALVALLRHLQIERAHVIGHSMGGGIAILLAAQQPRWSSGWCRPRSACSHRRQAALAA